MYSPGEVSKLLDVPPSTLRRWSAIFAPLLSPGAQGGGRKRIYTDDDLNLLTRIRDLSAHGVALDKIPEQLGQVIDHPGDIPEPITALALPGVLREWRKIAAQLEQLQATQQATQERLDRLEAYLKTPWYRRIGKKPPE